MTGDRFQMAMRILKHIALACLVVSAIHSNGQSSIVKAFPNNFNQWVTWGIQPTPYPKGYIFSATMTFLPGQDGFGIFQLDSAGNILTTKKFNAGTIANHGMSGADISLVRKDSTIALLFKDERYNSSFFYNDGLRLFHLDHVGGLDLNCKIAFIDTHYSVYSFNSYVCNASIEETRRGDYLISAQRSHNIVQAADSVAPLIMKVDTAGNILWSTCIYPNAPVGFKAFCHELPSGEFLVGLHSDSIFKIFNDTAILAKLDSAGQVLWAKKIDSFRETNLVDFVSVDHDFVILASDSTNLFLMRLDSSGNPLWAKKYHHISKWFPATATIKRTSDGGFAVLTSVTGGAWDEGDLLLVKMDSSGALNWVRKYGNVEADIPISLIEDEEHGFVFFSLYYYYGYYFTKTDSNGWNSICPPLFDTLFETNMTVTVSNTVVTSLFSPMSTQYINALDSTVQFSSISTNSCFAMDIESISAQKERISIFPNPAVEKFTIPEEDMPDGWVRVYDMFGKLRIVRSFNHNSRDIYCGNLTTGIYLVKIECADSCITNKLVIK